jgi:hypothetical protein
LPELLLLRLEDMEDGEAAAPQLNATFTELSGNSTPKQR